MDDQLRELAVLLYKSDVLLFGKFKLSSEKYINAYFDLAVVFSYPNVMNKLCSIAGDFIMKTGILPPYICGVSYSAVPFAVVVADKLKVPLLLRYKEIMYGGNESRIIGNVVGNGEVLVIEEVISSGTSTLQVIKDIEDAGMVVKNVLVLIDLEQNASENLLKCGYKCHSLLKISKMGDILFKERYINEERLEDILTGYGNRFVPNGDCLTNSKLAERISTKFESRIEKTQCGISQKLLRIIVKKKTNICADLAFEDFNELLMAADLIGPHICILCIHLSGYEVINPNLILELKKIASKHNFLLMDDCQLSEVGDVLHHQLKNSFCVVDLVSLLPLTGENYFEELNRVADLFVDKGVFLRGCTFTQDSLIQAPLEKKIVELGLSQCKSVAGFITHRNSNIPVEYVHMMSDMRSTGMTAGKSKNNYYSCDMMTEKFGADVVMLFFADTSGIFQWVKKRQELAWIGYENRFSE